MKINRYNLIRYSGIIAVAMAVAVTFQNCGQAGQISEVQLESVANLPDADGVVPPVDNGIYKDYSKSVKVNANQNDLDVLVVVDNSGSMSFEQRNMAGRFSSFLSQLQGLNWRVAITTTHVTDSNLDVIADVDGVADGKILNMGQLSVSGSPLIEKYFISSLDNFNEAKDAFSRTIQQSITGSSREQGIRATYRALERSRDTNSVNYDFFRAQAALSVIVVTDANETPYNTFNIRNKPENLLAYVTQIFPEKAFSFHSIIVKNNDIDCLKFPNSGNEGYGFSYQSLSLGTGGIVGSVCEMDYGTQLSQIGRSSAELVKNISLECLPSDSDKDNKPDVKVVNNLATNVELTGYTIVGNQLQFSAPLSPGDYTVSYKCLVSTTK